MRNELADIFARHGTRTLTAAISGLVVVAACVIVSLLDAFVFDHPLLPNLYLAIITSTILAPLLVYPWMVYVKRLNMARNELLEREESLSKELGEREQAEAALRESEERYRNLVENIGLGLTLIDTDYRIVMVNSAVARILNRPAREFVGKKCFEEFEKRSMVCPHCPGRVAMETGVPCDVDSEGVREDGSVFPVHLRAFPVTGRDGKIAGFTELVEDITEHRAMEEQLRHAQKMEAVGKLTGGVAHDFNNQLAIILGNLELVEEELDGEDRIREFVRRAINAANRSAATTQRLLAFSRKQPLQPRVTDVNALVEGMLDLMRKSLGATIEIETALVDDPWRTIVDPGQLENALLNLMVNACDAMPEGGRISIGTANLHLGEKNARSHADVTPGDYMVLSVSDSGCGMPPDVREHAFDPFFTTKGMATHNGLGLSMVYGFVKQSEGDVTIESEEGKGTTFRLFLPRTREAETQEKEEADPIPEAPRDRGETVLVVEDDADVRALVVTLLGDLGYEVVEAGDGKAAIEILDDTHVDLLLADLVLPGGLGGRDLAIEIRSRRPDIKVLYMSGSSDAADHGRLDDGAQVLQKPFRKEDLAQRICEALDRDRA